MPIEIRELTIRVSVTEPATAGGPGRPEGGQSMSARTRQELVAECVEQVLGVLRDRQER